MPVLWIILISNFYWLFYLFISFRIFLRSLFFLKPIFWIFDLIIEFISDLISNLFFFIWYLLGKYKVGSETQNSILRNLREGEKILIVLTAGKNELIFSNYGSYFREKRIWGKKSTLYFVRLNMISGFNFQKSSFFTLLSSIDINTKLTKESSIGPDEEIIFSTKFPKKHNNKVLEILKYWKNDINENIELNN